MSEAAPGAESPSLRLVMGGGEDPAGLEDPRPDLHAVIDSEIPDAMTDGGEPQAGEPGPVAEEEESAPRRHLRAAGEAGTRTVRRVSRYTAVGTGDTAVYGDDAVLYKKRGGGSYIRELMRREIAKLAAKSHPQSCGCEVCDSH
jgi:hypothetical protein